MFQESGNFPKLPNWLKERVYLSKDFCEIPVTGEGVALGSLPLPLQQRALVQDLLFLMNGIDGRCGSDGYCAILWNSYSSICRFIHATPLSVPSSQRTFELDHSMEPSLLSLVQRILPLSSHYSTVTRFLQERSRFVHGMVNQALVASMKGLLKEYLLVSAQLESQHLQGELTLQKMWYYVQPCLHALDIAARVSVSISKGGCRGGKTLSTLHTLTSGYTGDERSQELCVHLAKAACEPYFEMLGYWVFQGEVRDPYGEFMVQEHGTIAKDRLHLEYNDAYWERRYTVCQENIPSFLEHVILYNYPQPQL